MAAGNPPESVCTQKLTLNNGVKMPVVGLGTYRIRNSDVIMKVVEYALEAGYRLFDTAAVYGNEAYLKEAFNTLLPRYGLEREDIFVTTKLSPSELGGGNMTERAYKKSLNNLGLEYVDLYLIHYPAATKNMNDDPRNVELREQAWQGMAELYDSGRVNAVGVSNFTVKHLKALTPHHHGVVPAVNQVEWHPYYYQTELLEYCRKNEIVLQAYCSLGGTSAFNYSLIANPLVKKISSAMNVTPAQLLLQWAVQQDIAVIPKSVHADRIKQNIMLDFTISPEDMKALNNLGTYNEKYAWDPSLVV